VLRLPDKRSEERSRDPNIERRLEPGLTLMGKSWHLGSVNGDVIPARFIIAPRWLHCENAPNPAQIPKGHPLVIGRPRGIAQRLVRDATGRAHQQSRVTRLLEGTRDARGLIV